MLPFSGIKHMSIFNIFIVIPGLVVLLQLPAKCRPVNCCASLKQNLEKLTRVEILEKYDTTITGITHEMAYINENFANTLRDSSQIYLDCIYRLVDFDGILVFEYNSSSTAHSPCERIIYDGLTSQYYSVYYMEIKEFSYLLKAHQNSPGFRDMTKNLRLYYILNSHYSCLFIDNIIETDSDSIGLYPTAIIRSLFSQYEKNAKLVDEYGKEYFIQTCVYEPGDDVLNILKAYYRDGFFIKHEKNTVEIPEE